MDSSRDHDLLTLHSIYKDFNVPTIHRKRAHRKFVNIQSQVKDRKLTKMRYALIKASRYGDADDVVKLELQIKEYSRLKERRTPLVASSLRPER